jgi:hypothetical protein
MAKFRNPLTPRIDPDGRIPGSSFIDTNDHQVAAFFVEQARRRLTNPGL